MLQTSVCSSLRSSAPFFSLPIFFDFYVFFLSFSWEENGRCVSYSSIVFFLFLSSIEHLHIFYLNLYVLKIYCLNKKWKLEV